MTRQIKDVRGQLVGWTNQTDGIEKAYNRRGQLVGWYNLKTDHTHDVRGRLVTTSGDATSKLIFGENDEE